MVFVLTFVHLTIAWKIPTFLHMALFTPYSIARVCLIM